MREWCIDDRDNEVYVLHGDKYIEKKQLYPNIGDESNVAFFLLYNEERTVGYQLNYKYDDKYPKFLTYNSFGIIYNKKKGICKPQIDVIFEDATVRLLAFEHPVQKVRDYFLVGRWRSPSLFEMNDIIERVEE